MNIEYIYQEIQEQVRSCIENLSDTHKFCGDKECIEAATNDLKEFVKILEKASKTLRNEYRLYITDSHNDYI
jgi:hypothetical protein